MAGSKKQAKATPKSEARKKRAPAAKPAKKTARKPAAKKPAKEKRREGRPTKYDAALHVPLAEAWAAAGKTDRQIAEKLGIAESTLNLWKSEHPEFSESLTRGKAGPDEQVESSLFARATGYSFDSEKLLVVSDGKDLGSHVERLPIVEHCPPDVTACIFWLKNRRPDRWRDKQEIEQRNIEPPKLELVLEGVPPEAKS